MTAETKPRETSEEPAAPPGSTKGELVFVLKYDEEIACLITDGTLRQDMLPSGLK